MNIMGVDPSIANLAWARADGRSGIERCELRGFSRIICLGEMIVNHAVGTESEIVFIEGYSFASQFQAHQLGELGGVIRYLLFKRGIRYVEVPPQTLKKFVTGKGSSKKDEMRLGVFKHWGREFRTDHEIDAFGLAMFGEAIFNGLQGLTAYQTEAVEKLRSKMDERQ